MGIPQILMITLLTISVFSVAREHGKPKQGVYDIRVTLISAGINVGLLIWGGFFGK